MKRHTGSGNAEGRRREGKETGEEGKKASWKKDEGHNRILEPLPNSACCFRKRTWEDEAAEVKVKEPPSPLVVKRRTWAPLAV